MARLFIGTASNRDPKWPYPQCLGELMAMTRGFDAMMMGVEMGCSIPQARTALVKKACDRGASHILFLDDDMSFPPNTADRLLGHGKQIIAANYTSRGFPLKPLAQVRKVSVQSKERIGIQRVDRAPTGVMLIDLRVFDKIGLPWFDTPWVDDEHQMTDDYFLCDKARAAGIEIWIDHDLSQEIGHVGHHPFHHAMIAGGEREDSLTMARELLSA